MTIPSIHNQVWSCMNISVMISAKNDVLTEVSSPTTSLNYNLNFIHENRYCPEAQTTLQVSIINTLFLATICLYWVDSLDNEVTFWVRLRGDGAINIGRS